MRLICSDYSFIIPHMTDGNFRRIKSFVLRTGRLTKARQDAISELGPLYLIPFDKEMFDKTDLLKLLGETQERGGKVIVEIGFGNGEATASIAERNSENLYICIEVYPPGVGNLLKLIGYKKLENIRIINHDAFEVIECMKGKAEADGFHIFFPDPWQKKKHNKRRIMNREFTLSLADCLSEGGYIYAVTDWKDYGMQMQEVFRSISALCSPYSGFAQKNDEKPLLPWRPETNFERKGLKQNHLVYESYFIKKGRLF